MLRCCFFLAVTALDYKKQLKQVDTTSYLKFTEEVVDQAFMRLVL